MISYYLPDYVDESEDRVTVRAGYGVRLFNQNGYDQVRNVIDLLRVNPQSRRAVVQLFNAEDISRHYREIPCTTTVQFMIRDNCMHMVTNMRSNDAYKGLPHDVFCFTMLQEIMARSLGCELGLYKHFVGSMRLYQANRENAQQYLDEEVQRTIEMPPMPEGNPWPSIRKLLLAEHRIRTGDPVDAGAWGLDPYWADLIRLLQVFAATGNSKRIEALKSAMACHLYRPYIDSRREMKPRAPQQPVQLSLRV